jgi:ketosteroid isomerase-like protein
MRTPRLTRRGIVIAAIVAGLAAGAGAVVLLTGKGGSAPRAAIRPAAVASIAATGTAATTAPSQSVTSVAAVEAVLDDYRAAYSAESTTRLAELFAPTLVREDKDRPPEDRAAAIATYEGQFAELVHPVYRLADVKVTPQMGGALASAVYRITDQNGTVQNPIAFHLTLVGDRLEIDKITVSGS